MSSRRISKVNEAIRETVATEILCRLRDPRVKNVTVLRAESAADMRTAKVYVSVMGDEKTQALTMHGLRSATGYLQSQLADRLQTRYTPVLTFILDPSIKKSIAASILIRNALSDSDVTDDLDDELAADDLATGDLDTDEQDTDEQDEESLAKSEGDETGPEQAGASDQTADDSGEGASKSGPEENTPNTG